MKEDIWLTHVDRRQAILDDTNIPDVERRLRLRREAGRWKRTKRRCFEQFMRQKVVEGDYFAVSNSMIRRGSIIKHDSGFKTMPSREVAIDDSIEQTVNKFMN